MSQLFFQMPVPHTVEAFAQREGLSLDLGLSGVAAQVMMRGDTIDPEACDMLLRRFFELFYVPQVPAP
jgi:hypothetical protein